MNLKEYIKFLNIWIFIMMIRSWLFRYIKLYYVRYGHNNNLFYIFFQFYNLDNCNKYWTLYVNLYWRAQALISIRFQNQSFVLVLRLFEFHISTQKFIGHFTFTELWNLIQTGHSFNLKYFFGFLFYTCIFVIFKFATILVLTRIFRI